MSEINNENVGASTPSINRDTTMDIASLIKTAKKEEPTPTVTADASSVAAPEGKTEEAVKHKTKLEQMMEAKQNQTLGMIVDNDKLNHDENVQLKNKTADDAMSDADKYLADMDAQIDVAKKINFPRPENPQQMVGIMDALDRAAKNPDILKTGEAPAETQTEESKEAVSKDTTAEEKAPETPVEVKDDREAAKKAEDEKKEELKKQVINILIDKTGMGADFHFTDEEKEDPTNLYNILESNNVISAIISLIPKDEYNYLKSTTDELIKNFYAYRNSVLGILEAVNEDYTATQADLDNIIKEVEDPNSLGLLKEIMTKLG